MLRGGRAATWSGAGRDAEGEQGSVIAGPAAGVKSQDLAEVVDGGGGVQAVGSGQEPVALLLVQQRAVQAPENGGRPKVLDGVGAQGITG